MLRLCLRLLVLPVFFAVDALPAEEAGVLLEFVKDIAPDSRRFFSIEKTMTESVSQQVARATGRKIPPGTKVGGFAGLTKFPHEMILRLEWQVQEIDGIFWMVIDRKDWSIKTVSAEPEELSDNAANFLFQFEGMVLTEESGLPLAELQKKKPKKHEPGSVAGFLQRQFEFMKKMSEPDGVMQERVYAEEGSIKKEIEQVLKYCIDYADFLKEAEVKGINQEELEFLKRTAPKIIEPVKVLARTAAKGGWVETQSAYEQMTAACDACHASYQKKMSLKRKKAGAGPYPGHFVVKHDLEEDEDLGDQAQEIADAVKAALLIGRGLWPGEGE